MKKLIEWRDSSPPHHRQYSRTLLHAHARAQDADGRPTHPAQLLEALDKSFTAVRDRAPSRVAKVLSRVAQRLPRVARDLPRVARDLPRVARDQCPRVCWKWLVCARSCVGTSHALCISTASRVPYLQNACVCWNRLWCVRDRPAMCRDLGATRADAIWARQNRGSNTYRRKSRLPRLRVAIKNHIQKARHDAQKMLKSAIAYTQRRNIKGTIADAQRHNSGYSKRNCGYSKAQYQRHNSG